MKRKGVLTRNDALNTTKHFNHPRNDQKHRNLGVVVACSRSTNGSNPQQLFVTMLEKRGKSTQIEH